MTDWRFYRVAVPLVCCGLGTAVLYVVLASRSGLAAYWLGPPLMVAGAGLAGSASARRTREWLAGRSEDTADGRLLWAALLVLAGLVLPPLVS